MLLPAAEFEYNSTISEDLGMSPFEFELGYNQSTPLDLLYGKYVPVETVEESKTRSKVTFNDERYSYRVSKATQRANTASSCKPDSYKDWYKPWISNILFTDSFSHYQKSANI